MTQGDNYRHSTAKRVAIGCSAVTGLGWLLFFNKISQTPDLLLCCDAVTKASVAAWTICLFALSALSVFLFVLSRGSQKHLTELSEAVTDELRGSLDDADPGQRAKIESQLRELGA